MKKGNGMSRAGFVKYSAAGFMAVLILCSCSLCSCSASRSPLDLEEKGRAELELQSVLEMVLSRKIPGIEFKTDSSTPLDGSDDLLDRIAEILKQHPRVQLIVEGHADDSGGDEENEILSLERAEAVKRRLVEKGIQPDSVKVVGFGRSRRLANDTSERGRALSRRVEFVITLRD